MIKFDLSDETITGIYTSDPLRYAFSQKTSAHAQAAVHPVPFKDVQSSVLSAFSTTTTCHSNRCLYIHIPFCRVRCTYCNFFQNASSRGLVDDYFSALIQELEWKSSLTWSQAAPFQAVYVGGGTPTDLSSEQLQLLASKVKALFPLTPDCEITLEGRLNKFDNEKFERALEGGFNRFSFGVQSFDTKVRKAARRLDDREYLLQKISDLKSYNSAPIVLDLLYGLPMQDLDIWQRDLEGYLESGADGVDLYQLIEMPGMPMEDKVAQGKLPPPASTEMKATMFEMGVNFMEKHYQKRLSVNHWTSDNRERSIYNSLAKTNAEVLPVGAGAGGNIADIQLMQYRKLDDYLKAIKSQNMPVGMVFRQTVDFDLYAEIKSGLDKGVLSKNKLNSVAKMDLFSQLRTLFEIWQKNGLIELNNYYVVLTTAGQFWSVNLAQNLIKVIEKGHQPMCQEMMRTGS
ncbi:heme anaerobic degradation radical SAM methyltransferase ChuW/HutW [Vibrio salinus]|uniref:heme anaerobic degradation radical SAM methyltransferase ChuW/HutW n=1 Tax=Vibrio salinus TaxID=2899784 RepID=UPI001E3377E5|nr:heme anaerobic degradation radical SAM methyltransferase ChuW/HutW [Vibrio salinus]MCE0495928.1 heme anaerobic degradation radical SAM methyltransferase ChuW/HutW [Vibrio salinus]